MTISTARRPAAPPVRYMGLALASFIAAAAWQVAPVAQAQSVSEVTVRGVTHAGREVRQQMVSYADLNLDTVEGARSLLGRIQGAAKKVCSPEPAPPDLTDQADYKTCLRDAQDGAVAQLGDVRVSALYAQAY
ncbi:MAG TPA: UrcA family protein [Caulobacteraceae bacterium]|nr:UrcA family protein [Caulobacteraceae bacterium]